MVTSAEAHKEKYPEMYPEPVDPEAEMAELIPVKPEDCKIMFICSSASKMPTVNKSWVDEGEGSILVEKGDDYDCGTWLEEICTPYYYLKEQGYNVEICSIKGGKIPIEAMPTRKYTENPGKNPNWWAMEENWVTENMKKAEADADFQKLINDSPAFGSIRNWASEYNAIFLTGGHGPCVDFQDPKLTKVVEAMYCSGKIVASICHGQVALVNAKKPDGTYLVKNLKVTGMSDAEETEIGLVDKVPFPMEGKLKELIEPFGEYKQGLNDRLKPMCWQVRSTRDEQGCFMRKDAQEEGDPRCKGVLVCGQNPQSSALTAEFIHDAIVGNPIPVEIGNGYDTNF